MKNINTSNLIQSLRLESTHAVPTNQFTQQLRNQLSNTSKPTTFIDILLMKNKKLYYKFAILLPTLFILSALTTAVFNPALAQEVTQKVLKCGISINCYEKWESVTNDFGIRVDIYEAVNPDVNMPATHMIKQGQEVKLSPVSPTRVIRTWASHATYPDYIRVLESLGGIKIDETNTTVVYKLPRGSKATVIKPSSENMFKGSLSMYGLFHNDDEDITDKLYGKTYVDYKKEKHKQEIDTSLLVYYQDQDKKRIELLSKNIDTLNAPQELDDYFWHLVLIKRPDSSTIDESGNSVEIYEFNNRIFKRVTLSAQPSTTPVKHFDKFYDMKTGKLLYDMQWRP